LWVDFRRLSVKNSRQDLRDRKPPSGDGLPPRILLRIDGHCVERRQASARRFQPIRHGSCRNRSKGFSRQPPLDFFFVILARYCRCDLHFILCHDANRLAVQGIGQAVQRAQRRPGHFFWRFLFLCRSPFLVVSVALDHASPPPIRHWPHALLASHNRTVWLRWPAHLGNCRRGALSKRQRSGLAVLHRPLYHRATLSPSPSLRARTGQVVYRHRRLASWRRPGRPGSPHLCRATSYAAATNQLDRHAPHLRLARGCLHLWKTIRLCPESFYSPPLVRA